MPTFGLFFQPQSPTIPLSCPRLTTFQAGLGRVWLRRPYWRSGRFLASPPMWETRPAVTGFPIHHQNGISLVQVVQSGSICGRFLGAAVAGKNGRGEPFGPAGVVHVAENQSLGRSGLGSRGMWVSVRRRKSSRSGTQ